MFATNWQQSGTGLMGDFDGSETVDFNDLTIMAYYWLQPVNWPVEVLSDIAFSVNVTDPVDLAIAPDSNLYVLSSSQHQVKIYNNQLQLQSSLDVTAINPRGLAVDVNNNIYIADTGNNRILKYGPNGSLDTTFGTSGSGDGQFSQPQSIAIDWNGKIYVADSSNNRVQIFNPNGTFVGKWGEFGVSNGNLSNPSGMCLLGNSEIFIADTNNNRIQRLGAASGYFLSKVGSLGSGYTQLNTPGDICYDIAFDQIIVADSNNNRLQIFQLHSYGGNNSSEMTFAKAISDQSLSNPTAVACKYDSNDPNQIIFVADTGNNRVLKLRVQNDQQDNSPLAIFNTFKAALDANDVNAAIDCFADIAKEEYSKVLHDLQPHFQEMVSAMGEMILMSQNEYTAEYSLMSETDGDMIAFPVSFIRDEMGNWKISDF
jgi:streptogramin lyase